MGRGQRRREKLEQILGRMGVKIDRWTIVEPTSALLDLVHLEPPQRMLAALSLADLELLGHLDLAPAEPHPLAWIPALGLIHWDLFLPSTLLQSVLHSISHT